MTIKRIRNRKNVKVNIRNRKINSFYKSTVKTLIKKLKLLISVFKKDTTKENLHDHIQVLYRILTSKLDKGVKKGCIKLNTSSRKKSLFSNLLKKSLIKN
jgi:ribosomal protein S20